MKPKIFSTALLALAAFAVSPLAAATNPVAKSHAVQFSASCYATYDFHFEGNGAWFGHLWVKLGDQPVKLATFVDRGTSFGMNNDRSYYGTETMSVTFVDGSGTFDILFSFESTPGSAPFMMKLHAIGAIAKGTGDYVHATGVVTAEGPYLDYPESESEIAGPLTTISEMHGQISGLVEK